MVNIFLLYAGLLILSIAVLPVIALWLNSESLLLLLQQPPCVVRQASQFLGIFTLMLPVCPPCLSFTQYLSLSFPLAVYRFDNDSAVSPGPECGMGIHRH